jgi:hypothetical protein
VIAGAFALAGLLLAAIAAAMSWTKTGRFYVGLTVSTLVLAVIALLLFISAHSGI